MPDRHDPNLSMRPPGERKPEQKAAGPTNDDPLVELARVVSNRPNSVGGSARTQTSTGSTKPSAPGSTAAPLPSETDLARDLEEELLNELQASFSMVPEVVGQSAKKPPETPSLVANEPSGRTAEEGVGETEQIAPTEQPLSAQPDEMAESPAPAASDRPLIAEPPLSFHPPGKAPVEEEKPDDILNDDILNLGPDFNIGFEPPPAPHPQQVPPPPFAGPRRPQPQRPQANKGARQETARIKPPSPASAKRESLANRIARAAQGDGGEESAAPKARRARAETQRPVAGPPRALAVRPVGEQPRRQESPEFRPPAAAGQPAEPAVRPPRQAESRWDPPLESEGQPTFDPSRFAPLVGDEPDRQEQGRTTGPDIPAEDLFFTSDDEEAFFDESAPTERPLETVPGYGDDDLLSYPDEDLASLRRRSWRVPLTIAAVLAVLVIGAATVILLRSGGSSSPPPIIVADASPTKITPENVGTTEGDSQSKLIYDRVDPNSEIADSQLVVPGDNPIADIPAIPEDTGSGDVSRVILEGGPAIDRPGDETGSTDGRPATVGSGTTVASSAPEPAAIGPRKVRTVVVRPDGTIVSSEAVAPEEEQAAAPQDNVSGALAELPPASETPPAPAAEENPLLSDNFGAAAIDSPVPATNQPDNPTENSASIPDIPPPSPRPPPATRPAQTAPTVVATPGSSNGPIDVTPGNAPRPATGGLGGGFLVQVSSQRSEATALQTFSELQRRYPSILGDRAPNIQRADLGERGVYYRVRVGYPTREQAVRMCESLKAAGGDCLLATR